MVQSFYNKLPVHNVINFGLFANEKVIFLYSPFVDQKSLGLREISSGIRISEFVNLNRDDINFENKSCLVFGKGKKMREVYFDGKTKLHMEEYLSNRMDYNEALFVSNNKPYETLQSRGIELMLQKLGKELGEEKVHPHKFRRTLATKAIDKGMPIEQVQHNHEHTKIETTLHYAFVN